VYLSSAVEWELGEGRRADPELATPLGLLITLEFLKNLREGKPGERNEQEHMALNELLGNLEVLLCYPPVPTKQFSPKSWFDPEETAVVLKDPNQLQTANDNTDESSAPPINFPISITEGLVEENWLKLKVGSGQIANAVGCRIVQGDNRPFYLVVETVGADSLRCRLDETNQKRLRATPALMQLGVKSAGNWTPHSNLVLVTNLQDIVTGRDVRRERQIREACESPQRFMDVLTVLCSGDDEERLRICA